VTKIRCHPHPLPRVRVKFLSHLFYVTRKTCIGRDKTGQVRVKLSSLTKGCGKDFIHFHPHPNFLCGTGLVGMYEIVIPNRKKCSKNV
jgi:hypothetical protein